MDLKDKYIAGKSSKINVMSTVEEINESEDIHEESQATVASAIKPRLRIMTRDSAYDSSENLYHTYNELENLENSKEDIQDVGDPTETTENWLKYVLKSSEDQLKMLQLLKIQSKVITS